MARIAGVDLPPQKRLWVGLTSIYGIGQERARAICAKANVDQTKKIKDLTEEEVNQLRQAIESEGRVEGDLRKEMQMNIRRLIEIQCYRGLRHRRNLPVHGQRTHTNARTRKGPRKGAVAAKKKDGGSQVTRFQEVFDREGNSVAKEAQDSGAATAAAENLRRSARKSLRRSATAKSCRTAWPAFRRHSTTRSSPSPLPMAAPCAGLPQVRSASRARARALRTPRSRRR